MRSSELTHNNIISLARTAMPVQAKSCLAAVALLCASMASAEGAQPTWQYDKVAQAEPSKSFGNIEFSDEQVLEEELNNWVLFGGEVKNRGNRYIAAEKIRVLFYGEVMNPGEVTDWRFSSSDLDLSNLNLTSLPNVFCLRPLVEKLSFINLENNQLTELPETFCGLVNLQVLSLNDNCFTEIPNEISFLKNLRMFVIMNNDLETVPASLGELEQLQMLYLGINHIASLPEELANLVNLEELDLSVNQLTEMPQWIQGLPKLRYLYLGGNPLGDK